MNFFPPKFVGLTSAGALAEGYKLYVYAAGTTTPSTVYSDADDGAATNPYTLDARGECEVWLNPASSYKFELKVSASGSTVWTVDDIAVENTREFGTFTVSASGPFAAESVDFKYYRSGKTVTLDMQGVLKAGQSSATAITLDFTNMPASIRPRLQQLLVLVPVRDNGSDQAAPGAILLPTSGNGTIYKTGALAAFTSSTNSTGWSSFSVTYMTA